MASDRSCCWQPHPGTYAHAFEVSLLVEHKLKGVRMSLAIWLSGGGSEVATTGTFSGNTVPHIKMKLHSNVPNPKWICLTLYQHIEGKGPEAYGRSIILRESDTYGYAEISSPTVALAKDKDFDKVGKVANLLASGAELLSMAQAREDVLGTHDANELEHACVLQTSWFKGLACVDEEFKRADVSRVTYTHPFPVPVVLFYANAHKYIRISEEWFLTRIQQTLPFFMEGVTMAQFAAYAAACAEGIEPGGRKHEEWDRVMLVATHAVSDYFSMQTYQHDRLVVEKGGGEEVIEDFSKSYWLGFFDCEDLANAIVMGLSHLARGTWNSPLLTDLQKMLNLYALCSAKVKARAASMDRGGASGAGEPWKRQKGWHTAFRTYHMCVAFVPMSNVYKMIGLTPDKDTRMVAAWVKVVLTERGGEQGALYTCFGESTTPVCNNQLIRTANDDQGRYYRELFNAGLPPVPMVTGANCKQSCKVYGGVIALYTDALCHDEVVARLGPYNVNLTTKFAVAHDGVVGADVADFYYPNNTTMIPCPVGVKDLKRVEEKLRTLEHPLPMLVPCMGAARAAPKPPGSTAVRVGEKKPDMGSTHDIMFGCMGCGQNRIMYVTPND